MGDIEVDYKIFTDLSKGREVTRKKFEHYRVKLAKLREKEAKKDSGNVTSGAIMFNRGGTKDHERLVRNVEKFEKSEHYFKSATRTMDEKITLLLKRLDQVGIFLNIKFVQNITLTFYKMQDEMFSKMNNMHNEVDDIKTRIQNQVSQGSSYGNPYGGGGTPGGGTPGGPGY